MMKPAVIKLFFLSTILSVFIYIPHNLSQQKNFFTVQGKEIIDSDRKLVLLKGINLGNWLVPEGYMFHFNKINSPQFIYFFFNTVLGPYEANNFWEEFRKYYITKEDIHFIKSLGLNHVRIPFNYQLFLTDCPYYELKDVEYELLDSVKNWCEEENLYVILDMHCAPGGQTGDNIDDSFGYPFLFENPKAQELTAAIWQKIAENYKDEKILIGYDLLNEPIAHYFDVEKLNPLLEPLYKKITSAIRDVDTNHLILLGGAIWDSDFSIFSQPFNSKLVYTFHKYWTLPTQDVIQSYIEFRDKYNVSIWLGESGQNTNEWINEFRKVLERNNIGCCFWPYKKLDSERGIVSIKRPHNYDELIKFANSFELSYEYIHENIPDFNSARKILNEYLENIKLHNCTINKEYLDTLVIKY